MQFGMVMNRQTQETLTGMVYSYTSYAVRRWQVLNHKCSAVTKVSLWIYGLTFIMILPLMCYDLPYSKYFASWKWTSEELTRRALHVNEQRLHSTRKYIEGVLRNDHDFAWDGESKDTALAIGIITVKRTGEDLETGYLTQVASKLAVIFHNDQTIKEKTLFICNVYPGPGLHTEATEMESVLGMKMFTRFPEGSKSHAILSPFIREKDDYAYCLQKGLQLKPKYILMLEDDALPQMDILHVANRAIDRMKYAEHERHWGLLKLYYPEKWQGYSSDIASLIELSGVACIGGSVYTAVLLLCLKSRLNARHQVYQLFSVGALYTLLVSLSIGRIYLMDLRRVSSFLYMITAAPGCCSPANIYTQEAAHLLQRDLSVDVRGTLPLDVSIDEILSQNGLGKYLIGPNLVQHIGFISTLKGMSNSPEEFAFHVAANI